MDTFVWPSIAGVVAILIIILGIIAIKKYRENPTPPDYRSFYNIGLIFFVVGIPLQNYGISALGLIFLLTGIVNKNKWKPQPEPTPAQRKFMVLALVIGSLALVAGIVMYFLNN